MYVAVETFTDPSDGQLVEAGRTVVSARADVYKLFPHRFKRFGRMDFGRSDLGVQEEVERIGEVTRFVGAEVAISHDFRRRHRAEVSLGRSSERPSWQLKEPEPVEAWRLIR